MKPIKAGETDMFKGDVCLHTDAFVIDLTMRRYQFNFTVITLLQVVSQYITPARYQRVISPLHSRIYNHCQLALSAYKL